MAPTGERLAGIQRRIRINSLCSSRDEQAERCGAFAGIVSPLGITSRLKLSNTGGGYRLQAEQERLRVTTSSVTAVPADIEGAELRIRTSDNSMHWHFID